MTSRITRFLLVTLLACVAFLPAGCHRMTEEEALESAREQVRKEMQPEIDKRRREIEDLKRQIEAARARLAAQESRKGEAQTP